MGKVLIIGNQCYDIREDGSQVRGGPANYQVPIFTSFDWKIDLLTKVSKNYLFPDYDNLRILRLNTNTNTIFRYRQPTHETSEDRLLQMEQGTSQYQLEDVEKVLDADNVLNEEYTVIIFSGIQQELSIEIIERLAKMFPSAVKVLDLQTLTRKIRDDGTIEISPLRSSELFELFSFIDIIRGSQIEIEENLNNPRIWEEGYNSLDVSRSHVQLLETRSPGELFSYGAQITKYHLSILPMAEIIDATGSGDIFIAAFVIFWYTGKSVTTAIEMAHEVAKEHLRVSGVPSIETSRNIIQDLI